MSASHYTESVSYEVLSAPVFDVGKCNAERRHFEVNVCCHRRYSGVERGGDSSRQRLRACQALHVRTVDVEHVACWTTTQQCIISWIISKHSLSYMHCQRQWRINRDKGMYNMRVVLCTGIPTYRRYGQAKTKLSMIAHRASFALDVARETKNHALGPWLWIHP